ncbi:MAG: SDR family oxidoreductase [Cyclobacteriaceae bacterium]|nr:SDR family oxidoreductase [Cyclobacteriaceae bacterium]
MKKVAVVTGGTKGIGKAIVYKLAGKGFDIVTCSRNGQELAALKSELEEAYQGIEVLVRTSDLSLKAEVNDLVKYIISRKNHVEILVNNTGVFNPGTISREPDGQLEHMINTNLYSAYYLTRGLLPMMVHDGAGHIFNICSVASIMPYANGGSYSISKYAMLGMTKVLREELKDKGIRVTAVLPGATYTVSWEASQLPETRFMKAEDVADAVYGAYALSKNSVVEEILIRPQQGDI